MGTLKRRWTNEDDEHFLYLLREKKSKYEIEKDLRRSESAINARLYTLYKTTNLTKIYERI